MLKTTVVRILFLLVLFGAWIAAHYLFDKKSADGLGIYVIIIFGSLGFFVDRWYSAKRAKKTKSA
jgi:positive regulator of sigma E activity